MRLYLVRHGQTSWNTLNRAQGHTDTPLDALGEAQAEAVGEALWTARISRVLCSDLQRAVKTAEPLAKRIGVPVQSTALLRERKFGDWEGLGFEDIRKQYQIATVNGKLDRFDVRAPGGGESFHDLWNRLDPIVAELFETHHTTALITHGGTASVLLARLLSGNIETHRSFRFANAGITELAMRAEGLFLLAKYNDTKHLDGLLSHPGHVSASCAPTEAASVRTSG